LTEANEIEELWKLIQRHQTFTKSEKAAKVLADWKSYLPKFVKVLPQDYARVLASLKKVQSQGLSGDDAIMAAFEENVKGGH
jgi:glutamate synthase (ferredoxin)